MKTFFVSLSVSLLVSSVAVNAKDKPTTGMGQKPMLLCYAAVRPPVDRIDAELSRNVDEAESWHIESHSEPERVLSVASVANTMETPSDTAEPTFASRGLFLKKTDRAVIERRQRAKFCMGNLLEGSLYDFKKKNDLHFEIASPQNQYRENSSMLRYESFNITFLIRFKL